MSALNLLTIPVELGGEWRGSAPQDAGVVLARMRAACLTGVALRSDRQPEKLRVDDHAGGNPYVWLHAENPTTAWVIVNVGARDWCNLSYQFGHELGHVLANSWALDAKPANPCQWLEEALVESFSLRGLAVLAAGWATDPPFANDGAYGGSILAYRDRLLAPCITAATEQNIAAGFGPWFKQQAAFLESHGSVDAARPAITTILGLLESEPASVSDIGALNRWPGRSAVPLPAYLKLWQASCAEIGTPGHLPARLAGMFAAP